MKQSVEENLPRSNGMEKEKKEEKSKKKGQERKKEVEGREEKDRGGWRVVEGWFHIGNTNS